LQGDGKLELVGVLKISVVDSSISVKVFSLITLSELHKFEKNWYHFFEWHCFWGKHIEGLANKLLHMQNDDST